MLHCTSKVGPESCPGIGIPSASSCVPAGLPSTEWRSDGAKESEPSSSSSPWVLCACYQYRSCAPHPPHTSGATADWWPCALSDPTLPCPAHPFSSLQGLPRFRDDSPDSTIQALPLQQRPPTPRAVLRTCWHPHPPFFDFRTQTSNLELPPAATLPLVQSSTIKQPRTTSYRVRAAYCVALR